MNETKYFANLEGEELLFELNKRIQEYNRFLESSGRLRRMRLQYMNYYGSDGVHLSQEVTQGGDQGELNLLKVNTLRNLLQHLLVLVTSSRPTLDCKAINTDARSEEQTILATSLLEYYLRQKQIETAFHDATEVALVVEEGYIAFQWDYNLGENVAVDPQTQMPIKDGDIKATVLTPDRHVINPYRMEADHKWRILRLEGHRWDLIAQYPELKERILGLPQMDRNQLFSLVGTNEMNDEVVELNIFYHEKTPAVPNGRCVMFSNDLEFFSVPLQYEKVPVVRITPTNQFNTPFGYSVSTDLLSLQQLRDAMNSILATNNIRFGTQNIVGPKGADINVQQLGRGMTFFELDPKYIDYLKPLQLTKSAPEAYEYDNKIASEMEKMTSIPSFTRGGEVPDLSGSAMALIQSNAIQFNSGLQEAYHRMLERGGEVMLDMLKRYVKTPKMASIVGANNRYMIKSFIGDDLNLVNRVICESGNPLSRTLSGRVSMAQDLLTNGLIKRPQDYFTLLVTGKFEPLFDNEVRAQIQVQSENEALMNGQPVQAMISDDPRYHVPEHLSLLDTPEARQDPQLVARVLAHVQQHIQVEANADPLILMLLGRQPIMPPPPPMPPPGQGAPSQPSPEQLQPTKGPPEEQANLPNMPTNPMSGKPFNPQTGGM